MLPIIWADLCSENIGGLNHRSFLATFVVYSICWVDVSVVCARTQFVWTAPLHSTRTSLNLGVTSFHSAVDRIKFLCKTFLWCSHSLKLHTIMLTYTVYKKNSLGITVVSVVRRYCLFRWPSIFLRPSATLKLMRYLNCKFPIYHELKVIPWLF